jgi:hypothetical protein
MSIARGLLAFVLLVLGSVPALARCGDDPGDAAALAAARAQVDQDCDCAGATTHGAYVSCAATVARTRVDASLLRAQCKGEVRRCAARSTCGKPGFVPCCRTTPAGPRCATRRTAAACTASGGTVGACPSCCDACSGGCPVPPTTCGNAAAPECNGTCPPASRCYNGGDYCFCHQDACNGTLCGCVPTPPVTCGTCPPGYSCVFCPELQIGLCGHGSCTTVDDCLPSELCVDPTLPPCRAGG